jgi:hypothetical protein
VRCGRLERSAAHANDCRSVDKATAYRCHHRCAVAGDTFSRAAACLNVIPLSIA